MRPFIRGLILVVHAHERLVLQQAELVFRTNRSRPGWNRETVAGAVGTPDRVAFEHQGQHIRTGRYTAWKRVLRIARIGIAVSGIHRQVLGHLDVRLYVESFRDGIAEVVGPLDLADRRHDVALDVVPLDVVDAAGHPDAVLDVVLG